MDVVVAGAGNVGRHLAADLTDRGHEVTLIEQDTGVISRARAELPAGVKFLLGDACEPYILEEAKLGQADVIVAATGDDEDNLVISLLAKQEFAVPRVVARVSHPSNEWMFTEQWGVDAAVSPPHILTALVELTLRPGSSAAGRPMYELRLPLESAIVAIVREGHVVIPQPETVLAVGDEIMAIAKPEAEEALRNALE